MTNVHLSELTPSVFSRVPVWDHDITGEPDFVRPVHSRPLTSFNLRIAGLTGRMADGNPVCAVLSGINLRNPASNLHLVSAGLWHGAGWFHLHRYFDTGYADDWPTKAKEQFGLQIRLPIVFDLTPLELETPLQISVDVVPPAERLTMPQIMDLILTTR